MFINTLMNTRLSVSDSPIVATKNSRKICVRAYLLSVLLLASVKSSVQQTGANIDGNQFDDAITVCFDPPPPPANITFDRVFATIMDSSDQYLQRSVLNTINELHISEWGFEYIFRARKESGVRTIALFHSKPWWIREDMVYMDSTWRATFAMSHQWACSQDPRVDIHKLHTQLDPLVTKAEELVHK